MPDRAGYGSGADVKTCKYGVVSALSRNGAIDRAEKVKPRMAARSSVCTIHYDTFMISLFYLLKQYPLIDIIFSLLLLTLSTSNALESSEAG